MSEPVLIPFVQEYDRFHSLMDQVIDACPDSLWGDDTGGLIFWVHLLHVFSSVERYCAPIDADPIQNEFPRAVTIFKEKPARTMSKDEMRALSEAMKQIAHNYFATLKPDMLGLKNETMTRSLGRECTHAHCLMALVRHPNYHLGCIDTVFRANGLPGVY